MFNIFASRVNYSGVSDKELLSNFRSEEWAKLKDHQKIDILQEVENRNAREQSRPACRVSANNKMDAYGCYTHGANTIEINLKQTPNNNSYNILDSVYHEGQHSYQSYCVKNNIEPPKGMPKEMREMCELEFQHYKYPPQQYTTSDGKKVVLERPLIDYDKRTCEVDSRNAAVSKVMKDKEIFRGDPEYSNYLKNTAQAIENYNSVDMADVKKQQAEMVWEARKRNDISQERYESMTQSVWGQQEQPAFAEAAKLLAEIKQERLESIHQAATARDAEHYAEHERQKAERREEFVSNYDYKKEGGIPPGGDGEIESIDSESEEESQDNKNKR